MSKLPENIRSMYTDAYKLHEMFSDMGNTEAEWERFGGMMRDVSVHHNNHPLMMALINAVSDQLERERKNGA